MTRRIRGVVLAAAVLPLVVLVGLRSAWAAYACQVDGEVRSACCCPKKAHADHERAACGPRIERPDCCDVSLGEPAVTPDVRESDRLRADDGPLMLIAAGPALAPVSHTVSTSTSIRSARPPPHVPLYLANRTILR